MSESMKNLAEAFAGESQANRKYLAFAEKAQLEGYPKAAKLFKAAAMAETIHAHSHLRAMGGVKATLDNLKAAFGGETHEFEIMYPAMIAAAKAEDNKEAERSFNYANEAEKVHAALYKKLVDNLESAKNDAEFYVCKVCGNVEESEVPEKCPICGAKKSAFVKAE